jgi:hypothetical protein
MSVAEAAGLFLKQRDEMKQIINRIGIKPYKSVLTTANRFNRLSPVRRKIDGISKPQLIKIYKYLLFKSRTHKSIEIATP